MVRLAQFECGGEDPLSSIRGVVRPRVRPPAPQGVSQRHRGSEGGLADTPRRPHAPRVPTQIERPCRCPWAPCTVGVASLSNRLYLSRAKAETSTANSITKRNLEKTSLRCDQMIVNVRAAPAISVTISRRAFCRRAWQPTWRTGSRRPRRTRRRAARRRACACTRGRGTSGRARRRARCPRSPAAPPLVSAASRRPG